MTWFDKTPDLPPLREEIAEKLHKWLRRNSLYELDPDEEAIPFRESEKMALEILLLLNNEDGDVEEKITGCITDAIARNEVETTESDD